MFFILSKTVGVLADPLYPCLLLLVTATLLRLASRAPRLRRWCLRVGVTLLLLLSTGAVASGLLAPLESSHPRGELPRAPAAIVMLAGTLDDQRDSASYYELTESADRFVETLRLAHRFPRALVVFAGGTGAIGQTRQREAEVLGRLARELGLPRSRLRIDRRSRNTHENAVESRRILARTRGPVILVTSAFHMPRSVACFARVGLKVVPWPVDYQKTGFGPGTWIPRPWSLQRSRWAIREYVGWVAYYLAGYV